MWNSSLAIRPFATAAGFVSVWAGLLAGCGASRVGLPSEGGAGKQPFTLAESFAVDARAERRVYPSIRLARSPIISSSPPSRKKMPDTR